MPDPDGSPSQGDIPIWNEQFHKWEYGQGGDPTDLSALSGDLLPSVDDTYDIGSSSKRWSEGHFSDFLAVGTNPASAGAIRLSNTAYLTAAGADETAGDIRLIGLEQVDDGGSTYDAIAFGYDPTTSIFNTYLRWDASENALYPIAAFSAPDLGVAEHKWNSFQGVGGSMEQSGSILVTSDNQASIGDTTNRFNYIAVFDVLLYGNIFASAMPASDPGSNGMWVNAANHNAVTIGSGA